MEITTLLAGMLIGLLLARFMPNRTVKRKVSRNSRTQPQILNPVSSKKPISVSGKRKPIVQTEFKEVEIEQGYR